MCNNSPNYCTQLQSCHKEEHPRGSLVWPHCEKKHVINHGKACKKIHNLSLHPHHCCIGETAQRTPGWGPQHFPAAHRGVFPSPSVCPHLQTLLTLLRVWLDTLHAAAPTVWIRIMGIIEATRVGKVTNSAIADKSHGIFLVFTESASLFWWSRKQ